ncbi:MAG: TlpA disulfide reductase family protein [Pirellulaceae bacterium]|jgi:thiol-disulfide isomerase/thioredoxin|nr:TlpA disulfide reductase family protein [Pirellulaceae bacterium]
MTAATKILSIGWLAAALLTSGCGGPAQHVQIRRVNRQLYDETIANRVGDVVLVDVWALWCVPCLEHFPHSVALDKHYADQGLSVISLNIDGAGDRDSVLTFLQEKRAYFTHLQSSVGGGPAAISEFDLPAAIPYYRLYDRQGKLRYEFMSGADDDRYEELAKIDERIAELLSEAP